MACADCGGADVYTRDCGDEICRGCHRQRAMLSMSNPWAQRNYKTCPECKGEMPEGRAINDCRPCLGTGTVKR